MSVSFYIVIGSEILHEPLVTEIDGETFEENVLELNVSNRNARILLELLGVPNTSEDLTGEIAELALFEQRCRETLAVLQSAPELDAGRRSAIYSGDGKATVIECAMSDGYLTQRVGALRKLAERALLESGRLVYA